MLRPLGARQAAVSALVGATLVGSLLGALPAAADPVVAPMVSIVSPTAGPVAGTVTFSVSIAQPDQAHPVTDVYFQIFGAAQGWVKRDVAVPSGQCAPTCIISADFDTKSLIVPTNPDTVQATPNLPDGVAEFAAEVGTSFGPTGFAHTDVEIDNHRPVLTLPDLPVGADGSLAPWTGTGSISTRVQTSFDPSTATSITGFRLMVPDYPVSPLADVSLAAPADGSGTGTITVDTSKVPPGTYIGYLVAIDSAGVASALTEVDIVVPNPYKIAARTVAASADAIIVSVTPTWLDHSTSARTWLAGVSVYQNGTLLGSGDTFPAPHDSATLTVHPPAGASFPAGDNALTVTAVDNRGIERTVALNASTTNPLTTTWTLGSTIIDGSASGISLRVSDSSQSELAQIVMTVDRTRVSSVTWTQPSLTAIVPASVKLTPGLHDVAATITLTNGQQFVAHKSVSAYGRAALTLSAPHSTTWGNTSTFRAALAMGGKPQPGALVQLQSHAPGSANWVTRTSARTGTTGSATLGVSAALTGTATWRVVTAATGYRLAGTSTSTTVPVTARFGPLPATSTAHLRQVKQYTVTVAPYLRGVVTAVQYVVPGHKTWSTYTHVALPSSGHLTFKVAFAHTGTYRLRVLWPTTTRIASKASASWYLRVVK